MTIAVASDHAGFALKQWLLGEFQKEKIDVVDLGAKDETPSDYPDFARAVATAVTSGRAEKGIVVCGSGVGACVAANKIKGIRAAVCHDTYSAHQGVEHDDMNVLCLGARIIGEKLALEVSLAFLRAKFSNEDRHLRRLHKIAEMERLQK